jgi:hypothetical protein
MAINIPIISSLDSKGFDKAIAEFKSLEGASAKTGFALKKAFLPAVAVLGGLAAAAGPAVSAASDLNETMSKTSVIFGDADEALFSFAETAATSLGQTKQQALDAAATFGTFGKAAGLTVRTWQGLAPISQNLHQTYRRLITAHHKKPLMRLVRRCAASLSRCVVLVFCCRLTQSQPKRFAWV